MESVTCLSSCSVVLRYLVSSRVLSTENSPCAKFSVIALCFISIPLIIEMDDVLDIWLRDRIPNSTLELSRCILILSILFSSLLV